MLSIDDCVDDLVGSLNSEQWRGLAIIRGVSYPYTLADKIKLIKSIVKKGVR